MIDEGWRLYQETHNLKDFRHNLVHGLADLNDLSRLNITNYKVRGGKREKLQIPYAWETIEKNLRRVSTLSSELHEFVTRLHEIYLKDTEESDG